MMYDGFNADGTLKQLDQFVYCQDEAFRTKGGKVLREIAETLMSVGVTPYTFHPESAPGCYEMSLAPVPMLKAADDLLFLRQTISAVCNKYGIHYTLRGYQQRVGSETLDSITDLPHPHPDLLLH